ncbi:MAG: Uma2 family endonuclease [Gemmataceae bacterium]|nr:Uma2 family endonuclease [Gemmataceae bacterium]
MLVPALPAPTGPIIYPESDGLPMADNTRQFMWIVVLYGNLAALFRDRLDVFVCGNQNWYPVEGHPDICAAPDVYVVFGRPKGHRPSYKQWEEAHVPMTVVFEILSPNNTLWEMMDKLTFYEEYGVEEYYVYDPDTNRLMVYLRRGEVLRRVHQVAGFVSPRLGIRFDLSGPELVVRYPDGRPFLPFEELAAERTQAEQQSEQERQRAEQERQRAEQAEQQVAQERQRAEQAEQRAARLAELSRKALRQEGTPEELDELQHLLAIGPTPPPQAQA